MSDLIKRGDAIKAVGMLLDKTDDVTDPDERIELGAYNTGVQGAINMIKHHVPSADRPQGKWIKDNLGTVICSECKRPRRDNRVNHISFCNSCGAKMKGADDECVL